jgi:hypothetical protein
VGVWGGAPPPHTPTPQSPIPNPHFFVCVVLILFQKIIKIIFLKIINFEKWDKENIPKVNY